VNRQLIYFIKNI